MDIKIIGVWRFAVEDAINLLSRLGGKGYELPTIGEVEALIERLERTSPFEVVASILADNDYKSHRQHYLTAFGGVLNCEAFIGCVKADGKIIDYWGGLADKLKAAAPEIDKNMYLSAVERLSNMVQENIAGMKADLDCIFTGKQTAPEPQQIATKLKTPEAKAYFRKAIKLGLMDSNYNWRKGLQMLACFAREMSLRLNMGKGENSDGAKRISWQPFETLFSIDAGKLRSNYNDIQKTGQQPADSYLIDKVFE